MNGLAETGRGRLGSGLALLLALGCGGGGDMPPVDDNAPPTFEEFLAEEVSPHPVDGAFIIDGDEPVASMEDLQNLYEDRTHAQALLGNVTQSARERTLWPYPTSADIRFCTMDNFPTPNQRDLVDRAARAAAQDWDRLANLKLTWVDFRNAGCDPAAVDFVVQYGDLYHPGTNYGLDDIAYSGNAYPVQAFTRAFDRKLLTVDTELLDRMRTTMAASDCQCGGDTEVRNPFCDYVCSPDAEPGANYQDPSWLIEWTGFPSQQVPVVEVGQRSAYNLNVQDGYAGNFYTKKMSLLGIMRHAMGHVLGFTHEHFAEAGSTCQKNNDAWYRLVAEGTDYVDTRSVMYPPVCMGASPGARNAGDYRFTLNDAKGARAAYAGKKLTNVNPFGAGRCWSAGGLIGGQPPRGNPVILDTCDAALSDYTTSWVMEQKWLDSGPNGEANWPPATALDTDGVPDGEMWVVNGGVEGNQIVITQNTDVQFEVRAAASVLASFTNARLCITAEGTAAVMRPCSSETAPDLRQAFIWHVSLKDPVTGMHTGHRFENRSTGTCLALDGDTAATSTMLIMKPCKNADGTIDRTDPTTAMNNPALLPVQGKCNDGNLQGNEECDPSVTTYPRVDGTTFEYTACSATCTCNDPTDCPQPVF